MIFSQTNCLDEVEITAPIPRKDMPFRRVHNLRALNYVLRVLVGGKAQDRVDQSALIKLGLDYAIGQFFPSDSP